jgi:hypothetical protein
LPEGGLALDGELAYGKARMTINREEDEKLDDVDEGIEEDEEERIETEKDEARARQIYNPIERKFDDQKRRVTDLSECGRVTLPKPMSTKNEALMEVRRGANENIYNNYRGEVCNKKGEVKGNLDDDEKDGLKSLQKRIKAGEVILMKTDKSGKLCICTREEYKKMGEKHTEKDEMVNRKGIIEKEKNLNGHVFFCLKMWGSGDSHGHRDRIIDSKVVSSEQLASLYLMYKDHKKEKGATRPVVTGCNSNTKGFSNSVSDLLESVNKAKEDAYEVVSGEDMLAKVENYNIQAEEIMREGKERLCMKMKCGAHRDRINGEQHNT